MFPWQTSGRSHRCTTKHTKITKITKITKHTGITGITENETFDADFLSRPKVPVNLDRTPGHAIREFAGFFLRDLRVLRGGSNWVVRSTPRLANDNRLAGVNELPPKRALLKRHHGLRLAFDQQGQLFLTGGEPECLHPSLFHHTRAIEENRLIANRTVLRFPPSRRRRPGRHSDRPHVANQARSM